MFVIRINKLALKIMKKNEMTPLPTQYIIRLITFVLALGQFLYIN